ncbi:hypothetical protein NDU88_000010 [Pleurodeles waltl]|uniref:Uncharacterized protein n=1 Tax=Pleurodeles waltl TaxID=8319 RepID=A0AAV7SV33_PLEWA|nr:hypothetical protein NDU88_000010 [Pleurodeles waltl]
MSAIGWCAPGAILEHPPEFLGVLPGGSIEVCLEKFHILKYKQPRNMVLVVGTGVSAAAAPGIDALKSWRHCLLAIIDAAKELQVLHPSEICEFRREVCARKDLLTVAHQIRRHMSPLSGEPKPTFFQDCLIKIFEDLEDHVCCPDVLQSILKVMEKGALVVTTNYDTFLETFGRHLRRPMQSLDMQDPAKVTREQSLCFLPVLSSCFK